jgi:hypothetical protein
MASINPFQGPINYAVDVQSPFEAALGGFKIGAAGAEAQAQAKAREQATKTQTGIDTFFAKPAAQRNYADLEPLLLGANKQQFDALQAVAKNMGEQQLESSKRFTGQLLVALEQNPETAKTILQDRIAVETDPQQKLAWQDTLKTIEISPKKAADTVELLGAATFGKDWYASITDVRRSRETAAQAPSALSKSVADASEAVSKAEIKAAEAKDTPARLIAEKELREANAAKERALAQQEAVKAKFAEREAVDKLIKNAADLGLTKAQTGSALAQTNKLGIESKKAALELEALKATGGVDPAKKFEQEEKLRKEYQGRTKVYGELGSTFNNIQSSANANTGPGDIALITGFMKMLDPGSVVRETEFATARDTAGLFENLRNQAQKLQSGQLFSLDSKQRKEYVDLAKQYLDSAQKKAGEDKKALGVVVKNYKLNADNVFGPEAAAPATPSPNSVIVNGQTFNRPATFTDAQWSAYKQSVGAAP